MSREVGVLRRTSPLALIYLCPFLLIAERMAFQAPADARPVAGEPATFRAEANLALVRFQVIAGKNDLVTDLQKDEVELLEDGVPQKIVFFEGGKFYPRTSKTEVHLLFDCSGSIQRARVLHPRVFSANLLDEFPNVRIAIWGFSGDTLSSFTSATRDSVALSRAMDGVGRMPADYTPLYRRLAEVARRLAGAPGDAVRLIVVISDGKATPEQVKKVDAVTAARAAGTSVFPVLINAQPGAAGAFTRSPAEFSPSTFVSLAEATGGRTFEFKGKAPGNLVDQILTRMAAEIRYEYVAGYTPTPSGERAKRSVEIVLKNANRGKVAGGVRDVEH
jgi:Ca-activated chloride channel homolog